MAYDLCFTDKKIKIKADKVACSRLHSKREVYLSLSLAKLHQFLFFVITLLQNYQFYAVGVM